jgi:hypothetical protein
MPENPISLSKQLNEHDSVYYLQALEEHILERHFHHLNGA